VNWELALWEREKSFVKGKPLEEKFLSYFLFFSSYPIVFFFILINSWFLTLYLICSGQGKTLKSSGWDFSISGSQGTGTFRSVSRPPQFRDKKTEVSNHQLNPKKSPESGYQGGSGNKNELLETSFGKDLGVPYHDEHLDNHLEDVIDSHYVGLSFSKNLTSN